MNQLSPKLNIISYEESFGLKLEACTTVLSCAKIHFNQKNGCGKDITVDHLIRDLDTMS